MKSFDSGEQLMSNSGDLTDPMSSSFSYVFNTEEDATVYLTANFSTWHMNQDLLVIASNTSSKAQTVPVYYTLGYWNETQPVKVKLLKGSNVLTFYRTSDRALAFKEFLLFKDKPVIPPAPANYTPAPTPSPSSFIELPASTTCAKQGIQDVPSKWCGRACAILGLKYTGGKARANASGCFALTWGQYAGNCNYNTDTSASCENPPCTLYGCTVQDICFRA